VKNKLITVALGVASVALLGLSSAVGSAYAQVAGSTAVTLTFVEPSELAIGWSVKKTLMGRAIYNEKNDEIGKVEDLIISPEKSVSYVIVGAGGFIGMGRHDVAIPVDRIVQHGSKLVMAGATKDSIKAMAPFDYASDTNRRERFVHQAEQDVARAKTQLGALESKAAAAGAATKKELTAQRDALQRDLKSVEDGLVKVKAASLKQWRDFEADVDAATARLRKSMDYSVS
jgi:sporulation protein YlmC with PRC-barrel domain